MYKQFDLQADLEPTIKPNEIFIKTSNMLRDSLNNEKICFPLLAGCLNSLISNINYQSLLGKLYTTYFELILLNKGFGTHL